MPSKKLDFSKINLQKIAAPEAGRVTYYDTKIDKLTLRVSSAGSKTFYVVKRNGHKVEWVKLGSFPEMTVEQARNAALVALGEFAKGNNPAETKRAERAAMTLGEAFERYLREYAQPHGVKGIDAQRALWGRCIGELPDLPAKKHGRKRTKHPAGVNWQKTKLDSLETSDIRALHSAIGATQTTMANRVVELISTVYNRAIEWGFKGQNPTKGVRAFKEAKRDRFMQPDEFPKFLDSLAADGNEAFKAFVLLSLLTGARRENVLGMRWEQVSFDRAVWRIPDTKNNEPLTIPLSAEAIEILKVRKEQTNGSPFAFPAESATGYMTPPKKRWQSLLDRAGLSDLHIHDLRRTMGSWQAITGASLAIIGKSLGHKSVDATMIYARLHIDPVRDSMERATAAMLGHGGLKQSAEVVKLPKAGK